MILEAGEILAKKDHTTDKQQTTGPDFLHLSLILNKKDRQKVFYILDKDPTK